MHFYYSMDEWELYDMEADPQEMNNLYGEADPDLVASLNELDPSADSTGMTARWST